VETFLKFLSESIRKRVSCLHRDLELNAHSNARIAILFSGGIDSLIIAALADKFIPEDESIDLVNVAFGLNPYNAPDRQTGINAFLELRRLNSAAGRWRFVEVNLNLEDIEASRSRVCELLNPQNTVMDFNIGSVLWHAARAFGRVCNGDLYQEIFSTRTRYAGASLDSKVELSDINSNYSISDGKFSTYVSPAKVLLSGLGADELLSGYGRHRTAFRKGGFAALEEELDKDISRIWRRNLGRDDRLMSDHSREVRFPFLDEDFVQFIRSTDLNDLVDLKEPAGVGDKKILRDAAISIGIRREYASLEKRAIQFGTKIANKNVAGYVRLSDQIRTSEMVQSEEKAQLSENLSKKVNKKKGKPGFE
jgi:asparagine synthetase B (glutamine-hydrolysing)